AHQCGSGVRERVRCRRWCRVPVRRLREVRVRAREGVRIARRVHGDEDGAREPVRARISGDDVMTGGDAATGAGAAVESGRRYGTAASIVASDIGENIVSGHLPPGSSLRVHQLAAQYEMSLTPVREAMQRLVT